MAFRNSWNGCQVRLTTHIDPVAAQMKRPIWRPVMLFRVMSRITVETRGATVLPSSTKPWRHGSITRPKSTAVPKKVKPWHPFCGFLFQKHFVPNNSNLPSPGRFTRRVSPYCKSGRRSRGRNGCGEEVTTVFITSMTPRKNTCRFRT